MLGQSISMMGRITQEPTVRTTAALVSLPAAAAGLHASGISHELDAAGLAQGLVEASLWLTLGAAAAFGGLGGVVAELLSLHGKIELPHRVTRNTTHLRCAHLANPRNEIDLGIFSRILLGAAAALAWLAVATPQGPAALVVNALVAGSAATAVLRLVQGRMLARCDHAPAPRRRRARPSSADVDAGPRALQPAASRPGQAKVA